eukprot:gnl/MRDRNA2_/MRDRNA2_111908_c0_seq1.p1 gnl/MRDRNA2_/MRDRNA2_111908_c0~~gnl/MRDRNA2_/MRDRNA2_111908_c0_seq1.p1  ORF type:complete len:464 (+),score=45.82 gnl/MRDRNA2_/MRDRNA2_111908_c0_seq1:95-1393(+)
MAEEGFCNKMCGAMVGACFGVLIFFGSIPLLGWNEFNYVRNVKILDHVSENVLEVGCAPLDVNMGKPVWVSCPVTQTFDFTTDARLSALMPVMKYMYSPSKSLKGAAFVPESTILQWVESKSSDKDATYSYKQQWVSGKVDSTTFYCVKNPNAPGCPPKVPSNVGEIPPVLQSTFTAPEFAIAIGSTNEVSRSYMLNTGQYKLIPFTAISFSSPANLGVLPTLSQNQQARISQSTLELSNYPGQHTIGDIQATFKMSAVPMGSSTFSVIALQDTGPSPVPAGSAIFDPWATGMKGTFSNVNWLESGHVSKSEMIDHKKTENSSMTWLLRFVGFLCMFLGLVLATHPVAVVPEILPCCGHLLGEIVGCMLCSICLIISIGLSILICGVAWLAARPWLGGLLLAGAAAMFIGACCIHSKRPKNQGPRYPLTQMV